ncbi:unnamed protein product [marine sediment metagenome]|uniref:HTH cro/C1-type domain-containing protein n=1 Tax=marine sediment metagenome TaxID=412755 RepID=X1B1M5_9ZZZZ
MIDKNEQRRRKIAKESQKIIGKNIKRYRKLAGISRSNLGILALFYDRNDQEESKKAYQKINKFEQGHQQPKAHELRELGSALSVTLGDFFITNDYIDPRVENRLINKRNEK